MVPEYHPYTLKYSTLPQLYKFGHDFGNGYYDKLIFQKDPNYNRYVEEKNKATHQHLNLYYEYADDLLPISEWVQEKTHHAKWHGYRIQDDFTIHKVENGTDKLIYTDVKLPAFWSPEDSLGKSLLQFHEPVPKLSLSPKVLEACTKNNFVRFVWSLVWQDKLNFHPNQNNQLRWNPDKPDWFIRVERQTIIGFAKQNCFLFVIKPFIVRNPRVQELIKTIKGMDQEFKDYKRITPEFEEYLGTLPCGVS